MEKYGFEKQAIFENYHEPIIDTQTWERVQKLRKQRKRPNHYDEVGLFSGIASLSHISKEPGHETCDTQLGGKIHICMLYYK